MGRKKRENKLVLKTKRLVLTPLSDDGIRELIGRTSEPELKKAYGEMLDGCIADPDNRDWYAPWSISLKSDGTVIGDLSFKGPAKNHSVEIGYGIDEEYRGNGYMTEACKVIFEWAFSNHEDVYFITAETDPDNAASQRVLEKLEFKPDGEGEEGPRFVKERPGSSWIAIYMCLGLSVGMSIGLSTGNQAVGMCCGIAIGAAVGAALDGKAKSKMEKLRAERKERQEQKEE